jgi:hypothetical protein
MHWADKVKTAEVGVQTAGALPCNELGSQRSSLTYPCKRLMVEFLVQCQFSLFKNRLIFSQDAFCGEIGCLMNRVTFRTVNTRRMVFKVLQSQLPKWTLRRA